MTQTQIRLQRRKLTERAKALQAEERILRAEWENLWAQCPHVNKYKYTACGDQGERCQDCNKDW